MVNPLHWLPWYEDHFQWWEMGLLSVGVGASMFVVGEPTIADLLDGKRAAVYGALVSLFGAMVGFGLAAVALFLQLGTQPGMKKVRESSHYPSLGQIFMRSIIMLSIATLIALIALVADSKCQHQHWVAVAVGVTGAAALGSLRSVLWVVGRTVAMATDSTGTATDENADDDEPA